MLANQTVSFKEKDKMISVIVPVYNVEKYIELTLESIVNQKYKDFELILVDDSGNDSSMNVAKNFLKNKTIDVKYIKQPNGGLSSARNLGLKSCNGDYVCFVDSDDIIADTYLLEMIEHIEDKRLDAVFCNFEVCKEPNRIGTDKSNGIKSILTSDEVLKKFVRRDIKIHNCTILISKHFLENVNLKFNQNVKFGEDALFMTELLSKIERIGYVKSHNYKYLHRYNSIMSTGRIDDIAEFLNVYRNKLKCLSEEGLLSNKMSSRLLERYTVGCLNTVAQTNSFEKFKGFASKILERGKLNYYYHNGYKYNFAVFLINTNIRTFYKLRSNG